MLRFYNGSFTSKEIDEMTVSEFNQYFAAIKIIESRETLNSFTVVDFPHLKSEKRKKSEKLLNQKLLDIAVPGYNNLDEEKNEISASKTSKTSN